MKTPTAAWAALAVLLTSGTPALADAVVDLPGPGLLGLVGLGVAGAIAVAKWRK